MFGKCVPIKKKKTGWENLCFTHFIWIFGFTKHLKELSILQYGIIHDFGIQTLLLLSREEEDWLHRPQPQCGNTGLQNFAANLYIIIFWMQLYIDITVTCTCVSILARVFEVSHGPSYVFYIYIWIIKGVNQMRNIGVSFILLTSAKINYSPMGFSIHNQIFINFMFCICCQINTLYHYV